ncbi:MAG: peptidase T [Clostridiales bacterium]|jgi:tripeptide aminopeptidase|nr:peptidase T [Clostridiales bacterium]
MIIERFTKLVKFNTQSDEDSPTFPSTKSQLEFGNFLALQLKEIGMADIGIDRYGYVTAYLPSNIDYHVPVIGFLAHMDTSPSFSGENVCPQIIGSYDCGDINLPAGNTISVTSFPFLNNYKGQTIITSSGGTLLGADDKAGVCEIIEAMDYLIKHPEIKHGKIAVAFVPDEEVGRGVDYFDVKKFGADFAYTLDGSVIGELETESFNAATAKINIKGNSVHPGSAKNIMVNSALLANEIISSLPKEETPAHTEGYEGFFHLGSINGDVEQTNLSIYIRDHSRTKFEQKKQLLTGIVEKIDGGRGIISLQLTDSYYNMGEIINTEENRHIVELAEKAYESCGVVPIKKPIRGGTDGSRLSFMGLPCPNIFTGGHNFHGPYEFVVVESMQKAIDVIIKICGLNILKSN